MFNAIADFLSSATIIALPVGNDEDFMKKCASMQKRAARLGSTPFTVAVLGDCNESRRVTTVYTDYTGVDREKSVSVSVVMRYYSIVGVLPSLPGFEFLGVVEFDGGAAIIRAVPGKSIPTEYRAGSNRCDHCNKNRCRAEAIIVGEIATGRTLQVGKSCVKDFLGHDMKELTAALEFQSYIDQTYREESSGESYGKGVMWLEHYMAIVVAVINQDDGAYRPSSFDNSTVSKARYAYMNTRKAQDDGLVLTEREYEVAKAYINQARELFATKTDLSDYEYNLSHGVSRDGFSMSLAGVLASLPKYLSKTAAPAKKEAAASSIHVGEVGTKVEMVLTYERTISFDGSYGTNHFHFFKNGDNIVKWSTNKGMWVESAYRHLNEGETIKVNATIKAHDEYKGVAQTVITRAKWDLVA